MARLHAINQALMGLGLIDAPRAEAISAAAEEVRQGALLSEFVVDVIQGGAGTVKALRSAAEHLGQTLEKGLEASWLRGLLGRMTCACDGSAPAAPMSRSGPAPIKPPQRAALPDRAPRSPLPPAPGRASPWRRAGLGT